MADDIKIVFTADIADLQRGLAQATGGIADVTATLKAGAAQVGSSFAGMGAAYAAGVARQTSALKGASDDQLAIARQGDRATTDIALDALKLKQSQVKEEAQLSQTSHEEERAQLLALEADRERIEREHLTFLQATYRDNASAYAGAQRQIDELSAQSALKRQEIERTYTNQVYADYRRTFDQRRRGGEDGRGGRRHRRPGQRADRRHRGGRRRHAGGGGPQHPGVGGGNLRRHLRLP